MYCLGMDNYLCLLRILQIEGHAHPSVLISMFIKYICSHILNNMFKLHCCAFLCFNFVEDSGGPLQEGDIEVGCSEYFH